jgi:sugar O-acyltransferase (sialic acid O-acetyltransferase NeuD family)
VVIGAGGFGRHVFDVVRDIDAAAPTYDLLGLVDDGTPDLSLLERMGTRLLGGADALDQLPAGTAYVVAIGDVVARRSLAARADAAGLEPATLVHPSVVLGTLATLGPGSVVCEGSVVVTNVVAGAHALINTGCILGHDARLGDFVSLMPGVRIGGQTVLEDDVYVGLGGVVLPRLRVGAGAVVGAAACVVADVEPGATVVGVPARVVAPANRGPAGEPGA